MNPITSGIYYILNRKTNQIYIGQSQNVKNRLNQHLSSLRHRKHVNPRLQSSFIEYGEENFDCGLIKACKPQYLNRFEKLFIRKYDSLNPDRGFNQVKVKNCYNADKHELGEYSVELVDGVLVKKKVKSLGFIRF